MTKNFKVSEFNELFGVNAVKTPYSGANYSEISRALDRALDRNPNCRSVIWCLDYNQLSGNREAYSDYPEYLYDDNVWNDVRYLLNKNSLVQMLMTVANTLTGGKMTSMDDYSAWSEPVGRDKVMRGSVLRPARESAGGLTDEEREGVISLLQEEVLTTVEKHPEVTFYIFFPPYSIAYWDGLYRNGEIERQIEREYAAEELLIKYDNVEVYSFFEYIDIVSDFDNYYDAGHYSAEVNSMILKLMSEKKGLITEENLHEHIESMKEIYTKYDYDGLY